MPNSNGRIYTLPDVGINLVSDVAKVLGSSSTGLGSLCKDKHINPWARYKPIPCSSAANNTPKPLTTAQRIAERYGLENPIDMFTADDIQKFEDFAKELDLENQYAGVKIRPYGDTHCKRLSDFIKTDDNGNQVNNVGYDHNAKPTSVTVTLDGVEYGLRPTIPEDKRNLQIRQSSTAERFEFPNDRYWMRYYFDFLYGYEQQTSGKYMTYNEEWLSMLDFITGEYEREVNTDTLNHGVLIFEWYQQNAASNPYWKFYCYADDRSETKNTQQYRTFSQNPKAFLDLTSSSTTEVFPINLNDRANLLRKMNGEYLFVDFWRSSIQSTNKIPILGLAYTVNIQRISDTEITSINRDSSPWTFELENNYGFINVRAYSKDGSGNYDFGNTFSSLLLVISTADNGTYGVVKEWNLTMGQWDDTEEYKSQYDVHKYMGFDALNESGDDLNPEYDGMHAVLIGHFYNATGTQSEVGTLSIELHRHS